MFTKKEHDQNSIIITPKFNIEIQNLELVQEMKNEILSWLSKKENPNVIMNLEECDFIDSTGLGNLIRIYEQLRRKNGVFKMCNINEKIKVLLEMTTMDNLIKCYDSLDDALKSL